MYDDPSAKRAPDRLVAPIPWNRHLVMIGLVDDPTDDTAEELVVLVRRTHL